MRKVFWKVALSVAIVAFIAQGCALYTTKIMVDPLAQGTDQVKKDFVKSQGRPSLYHVVYQPQVEPPKFRLGNPKPKMDWELLNTTKKLAIVGFELNVQGKQSTAGGSTTSWDLAPINQYANLMYDDLKASLEKNGFRVLPVEKVLNNAYYQSLEWKIEEYKSKYVGGVATAYGLKKLVLPNGYTMGFMDIIKLKGNIVKHSDQLQKLAQELEVDAVICANADLDMEGGGAFSSTMRAYISKAEMNAFASSRAELMYSARLPKSEKNIFSTGFPVKIGGFKVITKAKARKGFFDWLFGNLHYNLAEVGPDMAVTYKGIADLLAYKMALDQKDALSKMK